MFILRSAVKLHRAIGLHDDTHVECTRKTSRIDGPQPLAAFDLDSAARQALPVPSAARLSLPFSKHTVSLFA